MYHGQIIIVSCMYMFMLYQPGTNNRNGSGQIVQNTAKCLPGCNTG